MRPYPEMHMIARARTLAVLGLLAAGCSGIRPLIPKAARLCGPEISGARELLVPGGTVLVGEMHGTNESPRVVADLACQASSSGVPVTLAVELGASEQGRIDAFVASPGTADDRDRLLNGAFWHRPYQDGRTSAGMLDLLDRVRALRAAGAPIRAVAYDSPDYEHNAHEEVMANALLADRSAHPGDLLLVLCGNVHARTSRGVEWDPALVPMGARLREKIPNLVSLDSDWAPGAAWTCKLTQPIECGARNVGAPVRQQVMHGTRRMPSGPVPMTPIQLEGAGPGPLDGIVGSEGASLPPTGFRGYRPYVRRTERSPEGYDGFLYVGPISASPPAARAN